MCRMFRFTTQYAERRHKFLCRESGAVVGGQDLLAEETHGQQFKVVIGQFRAWKMPSVHTLPLSDISDLRLVTRFLHNYAYSA